MGLNKLNNVTARFHIRNPAQNNQKNQNYKRTQHSQKNRQSIIHRRYIRVLMFLLKLLQFFIQIFVIFFLLFQNLHIFLNLVLKLK